MPIEVQSDGEKLIFRDYLNRKVTILHEDYFDLMASPERRVIRPALEDCLSNPSEVWWTFETIEGKEYSYYKYLKVYRDLVFIAVVLMDDFLNFNLNNFYGYDENEVGLAENDRCGQLILSNLKSE